MSKILQWILENEIRKSWEESLEEQKDQTPTDPNELKRAKKEHDKSLKNKED